MIEISLLLRHIVIELIRRGKAGRDTKTIFNHAVLRGQPFLFLYEIFLAVLGEIAGCQECRSRPGVLAPNFLRWFH